MTKIIQAKNLPNRPRILFILEHYWPFIGGVTVVFEELAKRLVGDNFQVTVVTTRLNDTKPSEIHDNILIVRAWTPPFSRRFWFTFFSWGSIWKKAKIADILHTTTYNAAIPSFIVGKMLGKPVIITVHEVWGKRWFSYPIFKPLALIYYLIEQLIVRLPFDQFVAISKATAGDLSAARGNALRISTIYNGLDYHLFDPRRYSHETEKKRLGDKNEFQFLYFGRPGISKGVEFLVSAMAEVIKSYPKARLLLILGHDPAERARAIRNLVETLRLEQYIKIIDPVSRPMVPNYIAAADCVVVPSLAEGFGFTAAEACAMDRPVVTTHAGSLPEVVSGRVIMVKPQSSEDLARGLKKAIDNQFEILPKKIFSWEETAELYKRIYQNVNKKE